MSIDPLKYCYEKAAPQGSSLYYCARFSPAESRKQLVIIHALWQSLHEILYTSHEMDVVRKKFLWWQQELEDMLNGNAKHPVSQALSDLQINPALTMGMWQSLFAEMNSEHIQSIEDLIHHCHQNIGVRELMLVAPEHVQTAMDLSIGLECTRIISNLRQDLSYDRMLLPIALLDKYQIKIESLYKYDTTSGLVPLLTELTNFARQFLTRVTSDNNCVTARIQSRLALKLLYEIERDKFQVMRQHYSLTPLRMCWHAWRGSK